MLISHRPDEVGQRGNKPRQHSCRRRDFTRDELLEFAERRDSCLGTTYSAWFVGKLRSMPHTDNPNGAFHDTIEETNRRHDNLAMWQVRELR